MANVAIFVANTWIKINTFKFSVIAGSNIDLRVFIGRKLTEWDLDRKTQRWHVRYQYLIYNRDERALYLPRYYLEPLKSFIIESDPDTHIREILVEPIRPKRMRLNLSEGYAPRNEKQEHLIEFMTDKHEFFKPVSAQTGIGKTFCAEASICKLGYNAIIVLNSLIDQWEASILEQTDAEPDDVYKVQGYPSLEKLWRKYASEKYRPKIILFATKTLQSYAVDPQGPYASLPSYDNFIKHFGIGVKVVDECHNGFHGTVQIDLASNIKHSIYLSATYSRTDPKGREIFNTVFPESMRFGGQFIEKYTRVYMASYGCIPTYNEWVFKVAQGYNHSKYESYLLKYPEYQKQFFDNVLYVVINEYFIRARKDGQKLLILCLTRNYAVDVAYRIVETFPEFSVGTYFSGDKVNDDENPLDADIVVSTTKSASTGLDIKHLKTAINTVSFSSEVLASQSMGRLRRLPGEETIFVDIFNRNLRSHIRHKDERIRAYSTKALSIDCVHL